MSSSESPNKPGGYTVGLSTARFLDQAMLDDVAPVVPVPPTPRPIAPASLPPSPSSTQVESDEDVNSYMKQLLQRSNKLAPAALVSGPASAPQPNVSTTPSAEVESVSDAPALQETGPEDNWTTEEYMPKKTAPEREADVRAFRQLANASARGALRSFQQRELRKQSQVSGIVTICSFAAAIPLFLLSGHWGDNWSLCCLGAIGLAGSSAWHYYKSGQSLKMKR